MLNLLAIVIGVSFFGWIALGAYQSGLKATKAGDRGEAAFLWGVSAVSAVIVAGLLLGFPPIFWLVRAMTH